MKKTRSVATNILLVLAGTAVGIIIAVVQSSSNITLVGLTTAAFIGAILGIFVRQSFGGALTVALAYVAYLNFAPQILSVLHL
ncbi:MAG TPA: hypothetical protein VJ843_05500 [Candidatus Saccharimonadales bacterium]|nr:hypothetical protein [Candidatus Saccharimonadales bacterium]